jgi:drug/metabolite transporter (DMT)-like permease
MKQPSAAGQGASAERQRNSSPLGCFLVLAAVNLMWAFQPSGAKIATERLGSITVTLLPLAISTLIFAPLLIWRTRAPTTRKRTSGWSATVHFIIVGVVGVVAAQLGITAGVQRSLASNASILQLTIPVLTALLAAILLHEKMTPLRWVSFALAIGGVLLVSDINWRSVEMLRGEYLAGNLLVFWSCFGSAFYNTYSKKLLESYSPLEVLVYSFLVADAVLAALMLIFEPLSWRQAASLGASVWLSLTLIAVFSLSVSMILFFWVIERIDVTQASLSIYLLPVFGVWMSMITLQEKVRFQLIGGGILVFVSTYLVTTYEERRKAARYAQE